MVVHCVQTNELPEAQAVGLGEQRGGQKGGSGWTGNWNDGGVAGAGGGVVLWI